MKGFGYRYAFVTRDTIVLKCWSEHVLNCFVPLDVLQCNSEQDPSVSNRFMCTTKGCTCFVFSIFLYFSCLFVQGSKLY
jgi:hypothetical protein